jgi:two-component system, OmpR family, sensor kinase
MSDASDRIARLRGDTAAHIAAHELDHDAQAAIQITDQLTAAHRVGDTAQAKELIARLRRSLERLQRDVNALLTERGGDLDTLRRQPVNIGELIDRIVKAHPSGEHTLNVQAAGAVMLNVDPVKVERIVDNLLANALVHTPPDSPVRISASAVPGGAEIVVEDEGPGLTDELADRIFQAGQERPPPLEGTGMGLWIVGRFARLHDGHVTVEPGPGGLGARFRVWLPARSQ